MAKEKNKTELPKVMEGELRTRLIKLREDAGYDVSQMASVLCLSEEVINNIENEAFDLLPEPPYVRGYLRNYAKLGDEDASELINRYESLRGADADELNFQIKSSGTIKTTSPKRMSPIWAQVILLAVLLAGIAGLASIPGVNAWFTEKWESFSSQLEPSSAENNPSLLGELPVPVPLPDDGTASSQAINDDTSSNAQTLPITESQTNTTQEATPENTNTTDSTDSTAPVEATTENSNTTNPATENTTDASQTTDSQDTTTTDTAEQVIPSDPNGLINIKLVFNKEVWLRVKDKDNKTVFEGLNKSGTEKALDLQKPLTFRVGNAQGLSLFIDNKAVDISTYINGSIANFTLE